ncbi:3-methyl-2-oxobutanoate hydroxymethyltransferase [Noviherbaspirillum denitrificans]|uniref:3-methyl-2-oxobutanoate hydroxymethyltransferase n=1 Tax=Noviherbaspirillum denitrificans TaxID=1968433 RepID=A0A254T8B6_9BURK|nr:3-methyl-2-oxobutanoate hydroxymethyltransferase [Noviherbaspirillum denitrificans]OWW18825.1 3-methyl-2-oxobutanoate hydroxymethyltransferase [Noviherbaspirillum denitrificans]
MQAEQRQGGQLTIAGLHGMHARGEKIAMLTCYDASFAALLDSCGVDILFVGDSLGNVLQAHATTLPVTIMDMASHTASVARGNRAAFVLADMPFGSYATPLDAYRNAVTLMQAGAQMVKLEGGAWLAATVDFLVTRGIPVCGHIGLTPQAVHQLGGFKVQGRTADAATRLHQDAAALQDAGVGLMVVEAVPATLGAEIAASLAVPTIGIGAGPACSGQVLVLHDMLGISAGRRKKFVKDFMEGSASVAGAVRAYVDAVKRGTFPAQEHCY